MYLTRIEIDTSKRKSMIALVNPNLFHGAIESSFTIQEKKLWRIDRLYGRTYMLLVSENKPDLSAVAEQFGTESGWESREYGKYIDGITVGEKLRFRLAANPVIIKSAGSGHRGEVLAHVTAEQQEKWLLDRAEKNGFSLNADDFHTVNKEWIHFKKVKKDNKKVTFSRVVFEGILTVCNEELFKNALYNGIGREKAYGCGLLTVSRK